MGFFSFLDSKDSTSIPAFPYAGRAKEESEVVLILPDNTKIEGMYDGYGRIGGIDIYEVLVRALLESPEAKRDDAFKGDNFEKINAMIKIVKKKNYKGERYDQLATSESCEYQGYFYPNEDEEEEDGEY